MDLFLITSFDIINNLFPFGWFSLSDKKIDAMKFFVCATYTFLIIRQANKEKISFGRLEVHEIAAFVLNSSGNYEAIHRNCPHYYLSAESVALFTDHLPNRPSYIVGLVVHIERQTVRSTPSTSVRADHDRDRLDILTSDTGTSRLSLNSGSTTNPYGLPVGCEYFVVTVAMLPDTSIHSPPPSWSHESKWKKWGKKSKLYRMIYILL